MAYATAYPVNSAATITASHTHFRISLLPHDMAEAGDRLFNGGHLTVAVPHGHDDLLALWVALDGDDHRELDQLVPDLAHASLAVDARHVQSDLFHCGRAPCQLRHEPAPERVQEHRRHAGRH